MQKQNNLIAELRATNNAAVPTQDVDKGKEEKGKEISVDREEEIEIKVRFNLHFIYFAIQAFPIEKWKLKMKLLYYNLQIKDTTVTFFI